MQINCFQSYHYTWQPRYTVNKEFVVKMRSAVKNTYFPDSRVDLIWKVNQSKFWIVHIDCKTFQ